MVSGRWFKPMVVAALMAWPSLAWSQQPAGAPSPPPSAVAPPSSGPAPSPPVQSVAPEAPAAPPDAGVLPSAPPPATEPALPPENAPAPEATHAASSETDLPRETAIENPLGHGHTLFGSAIGGYGELTLNVPSNAPAVVDLRRFVLFFGHNFSDRIRFYSEFEVEHAVTSSTDQGEAEIEQAYLDGLLDTRVNLRGGLILMPVGIINIYHEPPSFNGVDRPDVDLYVVPTTWREPGVGIFGELVEGLRYQLYFVNGLNANGFTAQSAVLEGHQEAQLADARDFGGVARLDYEPRLGTVLGASGYYATSGNTLTHTVGRVPVGLVEADARTRIGGFSARAEVAFLFIGDTARLNRVLSEGPPEQAEAVPVSAQSRGAYVEAAYDLFHFWPSTEQSLTAFARFDYADTQAAVPAGYTEQLQYRRLTGTAGLVWRPIPQIAIKADYRRHHLGTGEDFDEFASAITWLF